MSRTDTWMPLYVADYLADTGHLSGPEHGAYLLLIMHYWRTGPLPDDDVVLGKIARTDRKAWIEVGPTVRAFFTSDGGKLHHKRIDAERAKAEQIASKRSAAASARWSKSTADAEQTDSTCNANASHLDMPGILQLQSQSQKKKDSSLRSLVPDASGFDAWWQEYPRKDAKGAARKAYAAARKRASEADLLTGVRLYPFQSDPQFIPMPATWLNQGRWESAREAPAVRQSEGKLDWLGKYMGAA